MGLKITDTPQPAPAPQQPSILAQATAGVSTQPIIIGSGSFSVAMAYPNTIYAMAYGGTVNSGNSVNNVDTETRLQRLEKGQKLVRRGRVVVASPQFNSIGQISQTSANNPFVPHPIGGINYPSGQVPDIVAPVSNNSNIKIPNS